MSTTFAIHNLGCKVNYYEAEKMTRSLREADFTETAFTDRADVYIVNTCTVTAIADKKSRQLLHRAKELNPEALIVAAGCYVQTGKEALLADGCVDLFVGNQEKARIGELVKEALGERGVNKTIENAGEASRLAADITRDDNRKARGASEEGRLEVNIKSEIAADQEEAEDLGAHLHERTRAFLKIQDGCDRYCTYCIIPHARGPVVSYPQESILEEAKELISRGYQELVVTGIHVSSYGRGMAARAAIPATHAISYKTDPGPLASLLEALSALPGLRRLRLSSLEPTIVTPEFARRIGALPNLCPHFHLSLQSGCDATLKRMNRHYTAAQFREAADLLREAFSHPALTTDVIVGFPGETEEEFEESLEFCRETDFFEMHIFPYSKRKGTVAEKLPGGVKNAVKAERSKRLRDLRDECEGRFLQYYLGKIVEVLPEEEKTVSGKKCLVGHTPEYCLAAVDAASGSFAPGDFVSGKVMGVEQQHLIVKVE